MTSEEKKEMERLREMMANADLRDDDELLALVEARIEGENILTITSKPFAIDAGFNNVRTLNRKIQDALGVTPGEFRVINNPDD